MRLQSDGRILAESVTRPQRPRYIQEDVPTVPNTWAGKDGYVPPRETKQSQWWRYTHKSRFMLIPKLSKTPTYWAAHIFSTRTIRRDNFGYWWTRSWLRHLNEQGQDLASDTHAWIDVPICSINILLSMKSLIQVHLLSSLAEKGAVFLWTHILRSKNFSTTPKQL